MRFARDIRKSISVRLLRIVFSIYFVLTLTVTISQMVIEYYGAKDDIKEELSVIGKTFKGGLLSAIWNVDMEQIDFLLTGLLQNPIVVGVEIVSPTDGAMGSIRRGLVVEETGRLVKHDNNGSTGVAGGSGNRMFWHSFALERTGYGETSELGVVKLYTNIDVVIKRLKLGFIVLVINAIIKTIALWVLFLWVFRELLTTPLNILAQEAESIDVENMVYKEIDIHAHGENELKVLENALNAMIRKLLETFSQLDELNKSLESKVAERTNQLNLAVEELQMRKMVLEEINIQLESSNNELKETQAQLVEKEKMASLGRLVAGVAHEINTPVGISLTGITHFQKMLEKIATLIEEDELEEEYFVKFIENSRELSSSICLSLKRAADLVKSFKQVAVDQSLDGARRFKVKQYVEEILLSLHNKTKTTKHRIMVNCDEHLEIKSYPGEISQIITNFIVNSLAHAFEPTQSGEIRIEIQQNNDTLCLQYSDNGKGMDKENLKQIFEPFYTTAREQGGTGLGMHIVYNIVKQKLQGTIEVDSQMGKGVDFSITFPIIP